MEQLYAAYPLDKEKEEIRLFHIHPGPWAAELTGTFSVVSLQEDPDFFALSYTWGNTPAGERPTVNIQGCQIPVSKNLHAGLRRLRWHANREEQANNLVVWADALCISQEDVMEKQHQIPLMRKIYSRSRFTAIWLGELALPGQSPESPDMDDATPQSNAATSLPNVVVVATKIIEKLYHDEHLTSMEPFDRDETDAFFVSIQRYFQSWMNNAWFLRRWVLQEVILAEEVKVYYGEIMMELDMLSQAMDMYAKHVEDACCMTSNPGHYMLRRYIRGFMQEFTSIRHFRDNKKAEAHIFELCKNFANRETSLEADYVYALLGLTNPPSYIIPDYTLPMHNLLTDVCIDYIERKGSLDFLHLAGMSDRRREMPSWVIDWTQAESTWTWLADLFSPVGALSQSPQVDDRSHLRIAAYCVDEVDSITTFSVPANSVTAALKKIKDTFLCENLFDTNYPTGDSWIEAWIRTLSADSCWGANSSRRLAQEDYAFYLNAISNETGYNPGQRVQLAGGRQVLADAHLNDIMRFGTMCKVEIQNRKIYNECK
ncbi:hypothetical protein DM02DRAFT_659793 [Periconia macrospinosa]|uniref:Heterokaryon incompatibility domain-containing protein n=1 Tax=Periconia macrospinosa TaxID=97972 RepID=A0A2V1DCE3_9PLEO|nr:hypothetical protein DM02DRAFT_659793 [Periconia macrospinosa]